MRYGIYRLPCGEVVASSAGHANKDYQRVLSEPPPDQCMTCQHLRTSSRGMKGCPGTLMGTVYLGSNEIRALAVKKFTEAERAKQLRKNALEDREGTDS